MSGWSEIAALGATVRPLSLPKPPEEDRRPAFSASFTSTVELLWTELRALDARNVVVELDVRERDIRLDGLPRADARPAHDGVALSFESKFGPLRYATAEYGSNYQMPGWQANLRAIALSMQALRAVDRHGVSRRGEQYTGWRQLPKSTDAADLILTRAQAQEYLASEYGGDLRRALFETHPDQGGDPDEFRKVIRCKELLS
jgi:hypothetical protein